MPASLIEFEAFVMKSYTTKIVALTAFAFVLSATVTKAQTTTITKVPFTFNVGASVLPPDTYRVSQYGDHPGVYLLNGLRHSIILMSQPESRTTDDHPKLVFHKYGDQYFLREVWMADARSFNLPESQQERQVEERIANRSTPERIAVLANQK